MGGTADTAVLGFPLAYAETQRFSLGVPRSIQVVNNGKTVLFLRSVSGKDSTLLLWALNAETGVEQVLVDPADLASVSEELTAEERARRERARESAGGIVRFATTPGAPLVTFILAGTVYVANFITGEVRHVQTATPAFDPRLSPDGQFIAYVSASALHVVKLGASPQDDQDIEVSPAEDDPTISWGLAEFVAGEEMGRTRGFWWSPANNALLATRVDVADVPQWFIGDPAHPDSPAAPIRYPAAGSTNASVELYFVPLAGPPRRIDWNEERFEYLADISWSDEQPLLVRQTRDQRTTSIASIDVGANSVTEIRSITDAHWTELQTGAPRLQGGSLYTIEDLPDRRALCIDGNPVTEKGLQVRSIVAIDETGTTLTTSFDDPTEVHVVHLPADGWSPTQLTADPGVHGATIAGGTSVLSSTVPSSPVTSFTVQRGESTHTIRNLCEDPWLRANAEFLFLGPRRLATAIFLPSDHDGSSSLPVLLDPYGGPHAQRVLKSHNPHLVSRWFAEQGYAVIVTDGRGTPGRGPAFEREVWGDLAAPVLEDQLDALDAAQTLYPFLDLDRVGIRGWSFGGYLAALAAMRAPSRIHAAVAGAPVTDWALYDTHYTERYLGHPAEHPDHYDRTNLMHDAHKLERPLLLIHGLADDNVVAAHTLQLSSALLAHGKPHQVLPLSGVTHMTPQAVVAQNLLLLQLEFLNEHLNANGDLE